MSETQTQAQTQAQIQAQPEESVQKEEEPQIVDAPQESDKKETIEDDFVMVNADDSLMYEKHRASFFTQMETFLATQIEKCDHYKRVFESQNNVTMANKFAAYSISTANNLELLKASWRNNEMLPKFKFETVNFNCLPINTDVKDKELQIIVKTSNLPASENAEIYVVAEFFFPPPKDETLTGSITRWYNSVRIEPKNLICCSDDKSCQLDTVQATDLVPFTNPESKAIEYNRPITFYVDRGKSRTLKRKFKPIKLSFYEKTNLLSCDKKFGTVQVKINAINDEISLLHRLPVMGDRKQTEAIAEIRVKVREPLVNKTIRAHEEKLLILI